MDVLDAAFSNLTTPAVIAFAFGIVATLLKSDLKLPDQIAQGITIFLLLAIGIKGGVSLANTPLAEIVGPALGTLALGIGTPIVAYALWRKVGRMGVTDGAALAAHYGSVSLVTFAASLNYLETLDVVPEGFLPALLTILEIPAIIVALVIAKARAPKEERVPRSVGAAAADAVIEPATPAGASGPGPGSPRHENDPAQGVGAVLLHVLPERSVMLLVGGLLIGWVGGERGYEQIGPFFEGPFLGVLTLFLLQMGVMAANHLRDLRTVGWRLVLLAIVIPIVNGALGVLMGKATGLDLGGATVLGCMAASASYIAAPAAVSMALPKANPGYYLTASIGITFPFNVALGIPLYYAMATLLY